MTNAIDNRPNPAASAEESPTTAEIVLHVNDGLYANLAAEAAQMRSRVAPSTLPTSDKVGAFLFWEARLLDGRRYRDWLKLLTDDCIYWVPSSRDNIEARSQISINFDDRRRLLDRIVLTETNALHAQIPPSRTCRLISNIEAWSSQAESVEVRSNIAIFEHRRGQTQHFVGWQEHHLVPSGEHWLIKKKVINLLNCDEPQGSVAFIL
jgi:benzoate/toluate 1,2-dioxygenase beta subunit